MIAKKNILVVNSVYSLFLYSVVFNENLDDTTFVVSDGIPVKIRGNLDNCVYIKGGWVGYFHIFIKLMFSSFFRGLVFSSNKFKLYGQDHLLYSFMFRKEMVLIEDGLLNYSKSNRRGLASLLIPNRIPGSSLNVRSIILTGLKPLPKSISHKVKMVNIKECWNALTPEKRNKVNNLFGFSFLNNKCDILILTQPLSEYSLISEAEKIEIYKSILSKASSKMCEKREHVHVCLKPHPREMTDYSCLFPGVFIIDSFFPSELLCLNSSDVKYVYTIYSTSIYSFDASERFVVGTSVNKALMNRVGFIPSEHLIPGV
ncbi:glycosyltransferase family 52 [Shewanella sp. 0m-4]